MIPVQKQQEYKFYFYCITGPLGLLLYFQNGGTLINAFIWFWIFLIMARIAGMGYHRWLAHKAIEPGPIGKIVLLYFMIISSAAKPLNYVIAHRTHHKYADTDKDPHPPTIGLWNGILGRFNPITVSIPLRDIYRNKAVMFVNEHYWKLHIINLIVMGLLFPQIFLLSFALLNLADIIMSSVFNYVAHVGNKPNNLAWWTNFTFFPGEYLHYNHHDDPSNPNYGGDKWYNFDLLYHTTKYFFPSRELKE